MRTRVPGPESQYLTGGGQRVILHTSQDTLQESRSLRDPSPELGYQSMATVYITQPLLKLKRERLHKTFHTASERTKDDSYAIGWNFNEQFLRVEKNSPTRTAATWSLIVLRISSELIRQRGYSLSISPIQPFLVQDRPERGQALLMLSDSPKENRGWTR